MKFRNYLLGRFSAKRQYLSFFFFFFLRRALPMDYDAELVTEVNLQGFIAVLIFSFIKREKLKCILEMLLFFVVVFGEIKIAFSMSVLLSEYYLK